MNPMPADTAPASTPLLEACDLACLRGERHLFSQLSFSVGAGELLHVEGANGSGKTTLLRMLVGLSTPESGSLRWKSESIHAESFRAELCYLGHQTAIKEEFTALENILATTHLAREQLTTDDAIDALEQVGLMGREDLACKYLSQGQKRRVALARLVHEKRPLWILDEPFVALDVRAVAWLSGLLDRHLQRGGTVVMTTHQPVEFAAGALRSLRLGQ